MIDNYKEETLFIAKRVEDEGHSSSSMKAARTIRMLVTMLEAAQKDQARYQWLRDEHIGDDPESINLDRAKARGLDAAIDAAMTAPPATEGDKA